MHNLGELIDRTKDLEDIAIIDDRRSITYRELLELADNVKNYLIHQNIKPGSVVAIQDHNTINFVSMFLGTLRAGAIALPVNSSLPKSMIDFILEDSSPSLILKDMPNSISGKDEAVKSMKESDPAFILYTSGSTGKPKGVIIPHSHKWGVIERSKNSPKRKLIVAAPSYHMNGLSNIEFSLATHSTLVLMKKFDPKKFLSNILKYKINTITSVPTMLHLLLDEIEILKNNQFDFVKHIATASAPANEQLFLKLKTFFPDAIITNNYGLTEVGPSLFGKHPTLPTPTLSVGYPRPGIEYRIRNDCLEIKSPSMMIKYSNHSANLTPDGFFITNDMFEIDENGFYFFKCRKDDMFVCGGNNLYPRRIEILLEEHPSVQEAAIIGIEDEIKGMKPFAFVTVTKELNVNEIKEFILTKVEHYACPRRIWIIDKMPMTGNHKIDKKKLKEEAIRLLYNI
jgi:long-chain acyl-CoA synthetase